MSDHDVFEAERIAIGSPRDASGSVRALISARLRARSMRLIRSRVLLPVRLDRD